VKGFDCDQPCGVSLGAAMLPDGDI
jgi:hypothetical protein